MTHGLIYLIIMLAVGWSNRVGHNRETDEEHDKNCVEEGFQFARVKLDRDGQGCSDAPGVGSCSFNI